MRRLKRGESTTREVWFLIIGLVLAALVSVTFLQKAADDLKGITLEKNYIARDIALTLDAIFASPGDVEYDYSLKTYKFPIESKAGVVLVKKTVAEQDATAGRYEWYGDSRPMGDKLKFCIIPDTFENSPPTILTFKKKSGIVSVTAQHAQVSQTCGSA